MVLFSVETPYLRNGRKGMKIQKDHEKKQDATILLPAKKCHECRKSCRVAPLISCDFCCLYFHMDCLDPPLTTVPSGRWMCPNHVEHYLVKKKKRNSFSIFFIINFSLLQDSKLLTSISATERIKLWDKFNGPVDQDAIRLEFFRKIHNRNPPFRFKVKLPLKNRIKLPLMVKCHYSNRVKLLPSLKDVLRLESVLNRDKIDVVKCEDVDVQSTNSLCNGPEDQKCDKKFDENTQKEEEKCEVMKEEDFSCRNGCLKNEVVNGTPVDQKDNIFLPDVVSDITSEGRY